MMIGGSAVTSPESDKELIGLIVNFMSLLVLNDIDIWMGFIFKYHLSTYHEEVL